MQLAFVAARAFADGVSAVSAKDGAYVHDKIAAWLVAVLAALAKLKGGKKDKLAPSVAEKAMKAASGITNAPLKIVFDFICELGEAQTGEIQRIALRVAENTALGRAVQTAEAAYAPKGAGKKAVKA